MFIFVVGFEHFNLDKDFTFGFVISSPAVAGGREGKVVSINFLEGVFLN